MFFSISPPKKWKPSKFGSTREEDFQDTQAWLAVQVAIVLVLRWRSIHYRIDLAVVSGGCRGCTPWIRRDRPHEPALQRANGTVRKFVLHKSELCCLLRLVLVSSSCVYWLSIGTVKILWSGTNAKINWSRLTSKADYTYSFLPAKCENSIAPDSNIYWFQTKPKIHRS